MADKIRRVTMRVDPLARLGELVRAARLAKTNPETGKPYPKTGAADAAKVNRGTWARVEDRYERASDTTYTLMELFFDWEAGSILRYLDDDGPEPGPALVVSDVGQTPGRTLVVRYEGNELSDEDKQAIEALARRLARNGH